MENVNDLCTSCGACINICPKKCISLQDDEYGQTRAKIDIKNCIKCGLCNKVCPNIASIDFNNIKKCYAAWNLNKNDRELSTSGGIATLLSYKFIEDKGIVVGSAFNKEMKLEHIICTTKEDVKKIQGSKYLQSYIDKELFIKIKETLNKGIKVMFIGTPCQVAGLKSFLMKKNYDNLFLIDLVCHGVCPSSYFYEYIKKYNKKGKKIKNVKFRDKLGYSLTIIYDDDTVFKNAYYNDKYLYAFCNSYTLNENCYKCNYTKDSRVSDLTLGDFWGLGMYEKFKHSTNKVSEVFVNTEKGKNLIDKYASYLYLEERRIKEAVSWNEQLHSPAKYNDKADKFKCMYKEYGFEKSLDNIEIYNQMLKEKYSINRIKGKLYKLIRKIKVNLFYMRRKENNGKNT